MGDDIFISPWAEVDPSAEIGPGTKIWEWTKVRENARVGAGCGVGQGVYIDTGVTVGAACKIQNGVFLYQGCTVGDGVFIGPGATFTNDLVPRAGSGNWAIVPTRIENGASIGANATIRCGVTLGAHCMVGAGAVVLEDIPPHGLAVGNPARLIDYVTVAGERLHWDPSESPPPPERLHGEP